MEATANKIFTNTVGQITLRVFEVIVGVLTLGLITRYLGQEGFGQYTTVTALLQFFIILVDLGLYLTLLRELSADTENRAEHITNNIFTMRVISSAAFLAIAILIISFTPYPREIKMGVMALASSFLFISLISTLTALFQKTLQVVKIAAVNLIAKVLLLVTVAIIIFSDLGLQSIFIASSVVSGLSFILLLRVLKSLPVPIHLRFRADLTYWRVVIQKTWPIAVTTALNLIYFKADTIILSLFRSQEIVGIYGASYRVLEIIATFPHMFMGLLLPVMTVAWVARNTEKLNLIWRKAFGFFAFITLPLIAGALVVGKPLMVLIAGGDFELSGSVLKILIVATATIFFGTLYTYMVLVVERQRQMMKYFLLTAIVALIGYFIVIPLYGLWGAAWMTLVAEILIVIAAAFVVSQSVRLTIPWMMAFKLIGASVLMALFTWTLLPSVPLIPLIIASAVLYFILSIAFRAITPTDIRQLIKPSV